MEPSKKQQQFLSQKVKIINQSSRIKCDDCMNAYIVHYVHCVQKQENPTKETNLAITSSSTKSDH